MGRHVHLRAVCLLGALAMSLALGLSSCARGKGADDEATYEVRLVVNADEQQASDAGDATEEGQDPQADSGADTEDPATDAHPSQEPAPVDPSSLAAGAVLTEEQVAAAGGTDAFFWALEIPDDVFSRMAGKSFGPDCTIARSDLRYLRVLHVDAEGTIKVGELVCHRNVADELVDIFRQLYDAKFPIRKMHLVDDYDADDDASCLDDNSSCFNYRLIAGTSTLSKHAYGLAIDINTFENPFCRPESGYVSPSEAVRYADRSLREPYMIHTDDLCYQLFVQHGWSWGGNWGSPKDYQHFEKPSALWE